MRSLAAVVLLLFVATATGGTPAVTSDELTAGLFERLLPAVVQVDGLYPRGRGVPSSGVYVGSGGIVLTFANYASVGSKATVVLAGGARHAARVIAKDAVSGVAALVVEGEVPGSVAAIGDDLVAGRVTISAGYPFGTERGDGVAAAGQGIVAQYRPADGPGTEGRYLLSLAVNPGEWGGPLLDGDGRLAGILLPVKDRRSAFSQAVPVSDLRRKFKDSVRVSAALAADDDPGAGDARRWPVQSVLTVAAERAARGVVSLLVTRKDGQERIATALVVDRAGHVLTTKVNIHNADTVTLLLPGGRSATARIIATDERYDLGLLKVSGGDLPEPVDLAPAAPRVGAWVAAVGNPNGRATERGPLLSFGIVGALGRPDRRYRAIHTDAAINRANAGGALVDLDGRVVGMPTLLGGRAMSAFGANSGLGFAIPSGIIRERLPGLVRGESLTFVPGYLGVELAQESAPGGGVEVLKTMPDHAAKKAGVRKNDVITALDGMPVNGMEDIRWIFAGLEEGQQIVVTLRRGEEVLDVEAVLGKRP